MGTQRKKKEEPQRYRWKRRRRNPRDIAGDAEEEDEPQRYS